MPQKKETKKHDTTSAKVTRGEKQSESSMMKVDKVAFSFTAMANLNDGGETTGNIPYIWVSKASMIKCALSYGNTVIVQLTKEGNRVFTTAAVQLMKSLKENEVLCSESLFRCLSPSMDIIPITVFRLAPNSLIADAIHVKLSLFCGRNQLDRFNKDKASTNSNQDFIHAALLKLLHSSVIKGQSILFTYMGLTIRGMVSEIDTDIPIGLQMEGSVLIGVIRYNTQLQFSYEQDTQTPVEITSSSFTSLLSSSTHTLHQSVGGLQQPKHELQQLLNSALFLSNRFKQINISAPKGVLLYGPPGTGKTLLVRSIVRCYQTTFFTINIASLLSQYLGESERLLTELFMKARTATPSIIFLDEIDALCPPREQSSSASSRLCSLLLSLFDEVEERVVIIGATNRPNALDAALRRPGRFDREIEIEVPSFEDKKEIIQIQIQAIPHSLTPDNINWISSHSNGYTGADLRLLFTEASLLLLDQICQNEEKGGKPELCLTIEAVKSVLPRIRPSALREVAVTCPNIHWNDIGGLETVKSKMKELIEWPILYASKLSQFNITPPKGVLLYGPPGCSKTLLAKAVATEANMNFISVKGPELYSKYVGESEQALASVFRRARLSAPCVIFFDEIDAFASARSNTSGVTERVVSQFLTELDGIHILKRVLVVAATNRPDLLDIALLRPGRLDTHIYLGLPDVEAREKILSVHLSRVPCSTNVNVKEIAEKSEGYSGAELAAVCTEACMEALTVNIQCEMISQSQLIYALTVVRARTSPELLQLYLRFNDQYNTSYDDCSQTNKKNNEQTTHLVETYICVSGLT